MSPEQWQSIKDRIHTLLELDVSDRPAYLDRMVQGDRELHRELDSLLLAYQKMSDDFLNVPAYSVEEAPISRTLMLGKRLGPYQIVSEIGKGGMGEVYRAVRADEQYQKQVAIKLVRVGQDSRLVLHRFKNERQILASLEHPNIARLLDGGTTDNGAPYFVMELIEGFPIDEYCDHHRLPISERLRIFLQVCDAVQFAHQRLIIHRDIKPGNILVSSDRIPKLLDFGIAKLLDLGSDREDTTITMFRALTPSYASPEQIQGDPVTTVSDVYSLGVVLYELLTGHSPYGAASRTPHELARAVLEIEPERPSKVVARTGAPASGANQPQVTVDSTSAARDESPEKLRRSLRGELDAIALKALEKERARRYASASEFAADIKRYLNHEAVLAVPPSLGYQTRKFVRRHRVMLATTSPLALLLAVAAVVTIWQSIRANRESAVAEAVNEFLQKDLLAQAGASAQAGPNTKPDPDLKVRTALDRAAARIEGKFTKQPEVEASIRDTMGWTYWDLGLYPEARKQLERALELRRRTLGTENAKTLKTMTRLGRVAIEQGRFVEAETLETEALDAQRRVLGPEYPDTLQSMNNLAVDYAAERKYKQAERIFAQILEIRKRVLGPEHPDTLITMSNLASTLRRQGDLTGAHTLQEQVLKMRRQAQGPEHPDTLGSMSNLALVYIDEGKYAQAETLLDETCEIRKRVLGSEHPDTLICMNNLATDYTHEGKYAQAETLFNQILVIMRRVLGPGQPDTAEVLYNLGCVAARRGDKNRAIALLGQSVDHGLPPYSDLGIGEDTDLISLRGDPRFAALITHAKQVAEAKQKAAATHAAK